VNLREFRCPICGFEVFLSKNLIILDTFFMFQVEFFMRKDVSDMARSARV